MVYKRPIVAAAIATLLQSVPGAAQFPESISVNDLDGTNGFTVVGVTFQEFGWSVAGLGDINADGVDDIVSGGPGCAFPPPNDPCEPTAGGTYVIFGSASVGANGLWSTEEINGDNGFRVPGINLNDQSGHVSGVGDFNNDGIADLLLGSKLASPGGVPGAGEAYLIYGRPDLGAQGMFDLMSLDGANGFTIQGAFSLGGLGTYMNRAGDFNDDGIVDVALGAFGADPPGVPNAGQVYLLFGGGNTGELGPITLPNDVTADIGLIVNGISASDVLSDPAPAGDINGDGVDDLVMTALGAEPEPDVDGEVYIVYGGPDVGTGGVFGLSELDGDNGFAINGAIWEDIEGGTGVGDLNNDGYNDVAVAVDAPQFDGGDYIAVVFGGPDVAPNGVFCLADLNGTNGFKVIRVAGPPSQTGLPRAPADLNHDGIDDLFVYLHGGQVIFGAPDIGASGFVAIDDLDGRFGFRPPTGGRDRSFAGDVNNDGIDDIIAGVVHYNELFEDIGKIDVVFGRRMGDGDLDADVDFADFGAFQACFGDPPDGDVPDECHPFDFDKDNTIGLTDFDAFQDAFGTPP